MKPAEHVLTAKPVDYHITLTNGSLHLMRTYGRYCMYSMSRFVFRMLLERWFTDETVLTYQPSKKKDRTVVSPVCHCFELRGINYSGRSTICPYQPLSRCISSIPLQSRSLPLASVRIDSIFSWILVNTSSASRALIASVTV